MLTTRKVLAAVAVVSLPACLAQTSTSCNPLDTSCSPDPALSSSTFSSSWTSSSSLGSRWETTAGTIQFGSDGAEFTIEKEGDAPTIQTDFYIFFGSLEVTMQAAPGTGIVSSIVLLSDDLDEVDWEFTGGNTAQTQTNYFGKGNTTSYDRAIWYGVSSPQTTSHTYTVNWTSESLTWAIDGTVVRTLAYADANGGTNFPQTPMRVRIGSWAGGAPGNPEGTIEWAGGETDFSQAPFTMSVSSVKITNYSPGSEYVYQDKTGSFESIQVVDGDSSASPSVSKTSETSNSASASRTTAAAGTTVKQSLTSVASSVKASTASGDAQLTTIPLQASSTTGSTSSDASSTASGIPTSASSTSNGTATGTAASASQSGSSGASALSNGGNAGLALALFVVATLVMV